MGHAVEARGGGRVDALVARARFARAAPARGERLEPRAGRDGARGGQDGVRVEAAGEEEPDRHVAAQAQADRVLERGAECRGASRASPAVVADARLEVAACAAAGRPARRARSRAGGRAPARGCRGTACAARPCRGSAANRPARPRRAPGRRRARRGAAGSRTRRRSAARPCRRAERSRAASRRSDRAPGACCARSRQRERVPVPSKIGRCRCRPAAISLVAPDLDGPDVVRSTTPSAARRARSST